jgi:hypothetical protein
VVQLARPVPFVAATRLMMSWLWSEPQHCQFSFRGAVKKGDWRFLLEVIITH